MAHIGVRFYLMATRARHVPDMCPTCAHSQRLEADLRAWIIYSTPTRGFTPQLPDLRPVVARSSLELEVVALLDLHKLNAALDILNSVFHMPLCYLKGINTDNSKRELPFFPFAVHLARPKSGLVAAFLYDIVLDLEAFLHCLPTI
jgi:hypothetical protein